MTMSNFLDYTGLQALVNNIKSKISTILTEINNIKSDVTNLKKIGTSSLIKIDGGIKSKTICIECDNNGVFDGRSGEINRYSGGLRIQEDTTNNLILCNGGGKVGIGIVNPSTALHVNGSFTLGSILFEDRNGVLYINGLEYNPNGGGSSSGSDTPSGGGTLDGIPNVGTVSESDGIQVINIDDSSLSSGTYTLKYIDGNGNIVSGYDNITSVTK